VNIFLIYFTGIQDLFVTTLLGFERLLLIQRERADFCWRY